MAIKCTKTFNSNLIYLNYVGCQDELIFDGGSFVMNEKGNTIYRGDFFKESEIIISLDELQSKKEFLNL